MGKLDEFIEKRGGCLMTIFLSIQAIIYLSYTVTFCVANEDSEIDVDIFVCSTMAIFLIYMIHFAYHSVILFN
jgi:hypothetical protein